MRYLNEMANMIYDNREEIRKVNKENAGTNLDYLDNKNKIKDILRSNDFYKSDTDKYIARGDLISLIEKTDIPEEFYYRSLGEEEASFVGDNWSNYVEEGQYYIGDERIDMDLLSMIGYFDKDGNYQDI
jgi:hypothetical protein